MATRKTTRLHAPEQLESIDLMAADLVGDFSAPDIDAYTSSQLHQAHTDIVASLREEIATIDDNGAVPLSTVDQVIDGSVIDDYLGLEYRLQTADAVLDVLAIEYAQREAESEVVVTPVSLTLEEARQLKKEAYTLLKAARSELSDAKQDREDKTITKAQWRRIRPVLQATIEVRKQAYADAKAQFIDIRDNPPVDADVALPWLAKNPHVVELLDQNEDDIERLLGNVGTWIDNAQESVPLTELVSQTLESNEGWHRVGTQPQLSPWGSYLTNTNHLQAAAAQREVPFHNSLSLSTSLNLGYNNGADYHVGVGDELDVTLQVRHDQSAIVAVTVDGQEIHRSGFHVRDNQQLQLRLSVDRTGFIEGSVAGQGVHHGFSGRPDDDNFVLQGKQLQLGMGRSTRFKLRDDVAHYFAGYSDSQIEFDQYLPGNVSLWQAPLAAVTDRLVELEENVADLRTLSDATELLSQAQALQSGLEQDHSAALESMRNDWNEVDETLFPLVTAPLNDQARMLESRLQQATETLMQFLDQEVIQPSLKIVSIDGSQVRFHVTSPLDTSYVAIHDDGLMNHQTLEHEGGTQLGYGLVTADTRPSMSKTISLYDKPGGKLLDQVQLEGVNHTSPWQYRLQDVTDQWQPREHILARQAYFTHRLGENVTAALSDESTENTVEAFEVADSSTRDRFEQRIEDMFYLPRYAHISNTFFHLAAKNHGFYLTTDAAIDRLAEYLPYMDGTRESFFHEVNTTGVTEEMLLSRMGDLQGRVNQAAHAYNGSIESILHAAVRIIHHSINGEELYGRNPGDPWNAFIGAIERLGQPFFNAGIGQYQLVDPPTTNEFLAAAKDIVLRDSKTNERWHIQEQQERNQEEASLRQLIRDNEADRIADSEALSIHRVRQDIAQDLVLGEFYWNESLPTADIGNLDTYFEQFERGGNAYYDQGNNALILRSDYELLLDGFVAIASEVKAYLDSGLTDTEHDIADVAKSVTERWSRDADYLEADLEAIKLEENPRLEEIAILNGRIASRRAMVVLSHFFVSQYPNNTTDLAVDIGLGGLAKSIPAQFAEYAKFLEHIDQAFDFKTYFDEHLQE